MQPEGGARDHGSGNGSSPSPILRRLAALALACLACAGRPFDPRALEVRFPELKPLEARGLARITPYLLPASGRVTWFLCRFDLDVPIAVSLVEGASDVEEEIVAAVLRALERSSVGVRFVRVPPSEAAIVIEFVDGWVARDGGSDQANTISDCALAPEALGASLDPLPARLQFSSVRFGRGGPRDGMGRSRALTRTELAGALLHELGHALGFQGHAGLGGGLMSRNLVGLRRLGAEVLAGEGFQAPALSALYALPSGTVLRSALVSRTRTQLVDRLVDLVGGRSGVTGPWLRVGDRHARIYWRDLHGVEYGLQIGDVDQVLEAPESIVVLPEARTRRALPRERDLPLD